MNQVFFKWDDKWLCMEIYTLIDGVYYKLQHYSDDVTYLVKVDNPPSGLFQIDSTIPIKES